MGAFEDFINIEIPKRIVLLTQANTGYVGNPNLAVNAAINGAPQGTQFIDNTAPDYLLYVKQEQAVSTSWVPDVDGAIAVPDLATRDAIPAARRTAGMLASVVSDSTIYILGVGLGNGDWAPFSPITISLDVYLSSTGNDGNDGLTLGQAVATWPRAWQVAQNSAQVTLHLVGTVAGYEQPPPAIQWLTITGDDNFTEVATGVAGAGTTAQFCELAVATTEDAFRHFTLEYTSGAAVGYRRTIRDNSTTIVTTCHAFENHTASVVPAPGDTYRILRPSAKIVGAATVSGPTYRQFALAPIGGARVDLINVAIEGSNPAAFFYNYIIAASFGSWFGVLVEGIWNVQPNRAIISGADDFQTQADADALIVGKLGVPGYVHGQWHGWGLSFAVSTFAFVQDGQRIGLVAPDQTDVGGFFYGFVTCGSCTDLSGGILLGGSFALFGSRDGNVGIAVATLPRSFSIPVTPLLSKQAAGFPFGGWTVSGTLTVRYTYALQNLAIEQRHLGSTSNGIFTVAGGSAFSSQSSIKITYSGAGAAVVFLCASPGSSANYASDGSGGVPLWDMGANGGMCRAIAGGEIRLASYNFVGAFGVHNDGGSVAVEQVGSPVPLATATGQSWRQTAGIGTVQEINTWVGDAAELFAISGGSFQQLNGTTTITNNATGANDVLRVSGGAQAGLLGGAATVLDGSAGASGYAINARGGGRVFTSAQPSSCTGVTADITVGVGGGEDQPDTFLSASFSSLVSGDTLSAIARST